MAACWCYNKFSRWRYGSFGKCLPVLEEMVEQNMPLLKFPRLKVVMEHITTMECVRFVESCNEGSVAATVTPQHLVLNRNSLFQGGLQPHNYCLPVLKRETHSRAASSFFDMFDTSRGTDSSFSEGNPCISLELQAEMRITSMKAFFFLSLLFFAGPSMATDTIFPGQILSGNQTIRSDGGTFELGFFTPGVLYSGLRPCLADHQCEANNQLPQDYCPLNGEK
ncbi:hypothetical protein AAG906_040511 [Vitis piasezkii]